MRGTPAILAALLWAAACGIKAPPRPPLPEKPAAAGSRAPAAPAAPSCAGCADRQGGGGSAKEAGE